MGKFEGLRGVLYQIASIIFSTAVRDNLVLVGGTSLYFKNPREFTNRMTTDLDFDVKSVSKQQLEHWSQVVLISEINNLGLDFRLEPMGVSITSGDQVKSKFKVVRVSTGESTRIWMDFALRQFSLDTIVVGSGVVTTTLFEDLCRKCMAATRFEYPRGKNVVDIYAFTKVLGRVDSSNIVSVLKQVQSDFRYKDLNIIDSYSDLYGEVDKIRREMLILDSPESIIYYVSMFLRGVSTSFYTGENLVWKSSDGIWLRG